MTGALGPSALVAILFAIHPLHVESVAWVSERKDVLSTFFGLLALAGYLAYVKRPSVARYLLEHENDLPLHLLCAGTNGAFSIEDYYCAGIIASYIATVGNAALTDFAWAAAKLSGLPIEEAVTPDTCRHLGFLVRSGFSADVELSLKREVENQNRLVPVYDSKKERFISATTV